MMLHTSNPDEFLGALTDLTEGPRRDLCKFLASEPPVSNPHRVQTTVEGHAVLVWFDHRDDRRTVALRFCGNEKILYEIKQTTAPEYSTAGMMARLAGRGTISDHEQRLKSRSTRFEQFLAGDIILAVGHCDVDLLHEFLNDVGMENVVYHTHQDTLADVAQEFRSEGLVEAAQRLELMEYEPDNPATAAVDSGSLRLLADLFLHAPDVETNAIVNMRGVLGATYLMDGEDDNPGVIAVIFRKDGQVQWAVSQEQQSKHWPDEPGLHLMPGRPVADVANMIRTYL